MGYNLHFLTAYGCKIPIMINPDKCSHVTIAGATNSGKSVLTLFMLYQLKKTNPVDLWICDFKKSGDYNEITREKQFAEGDAIRCYEVISDFFKLYQSLPEGGDSHYHVLIVDELAGLLSYLSLDKSTKPYAEKIKLILSSILMLGRSRRVCLWTVQQRMSAKLFPESSGAVDNFTVRILCGHADPESRRALFAGLHFEGEDTLHYKTGRGIIYISSNANIHAFVVPKVDKKKLQKKLQYK